MQISKITVKKKAHTECYEANSWELLSPPTLVSEWELKFVVSSALAKMDDITNVACSRAHNVQPADIHTITM